ncbi:fumarylacetoacetate hydrolase family protein [Intestinimonas massiliensis (ex Afouda et al. 2020)]|uniref:fumarylacetoacetate hydrolase family protein n=1 Tax=Intestinimonas massiliensis (ex Afouda et al. 2020) TaxID=1673721 RepID=UPI00102F2FC4|nr:fumarylacetoacetate hydrolase family protein [Intestinimonas massiliensis (ex Afouda et al. 2020)]
MRYVKLLRNDREVWGVLQENEVRTLTKPPFEELCYDGESLPLSACKLVAPCEATKIVCIGKNYYDHIQEMRSMLDASHNPERPTLFLKAPNALNVPEGQVHAPSFVGRLDYEGELGVVMKRRAKDVSEEDALDYVLGYTCLNDVTARDIQKGDGQWARGKNMDGFAPMGPLVTDEVDPAHLEITTRLNGAVVQHSNTELLITSVRKTIAFITASMTLEPGDVIATGTPAGVGPMVPGDVVEVEIGGIGILRNHIV